MSPQLYANKEDLIESLVSPEDSVLDVGYFGGPTKAATWVHELLRKRSYEVYGVDVEYDEKRLPGDPSHYFQMNAEEFKIGRTFDVVFAGDIIEHLSNPGLFLARAKEHVTPKGRLILTTPNAFNLFNLVQKCTQDEPNVNYDHVCYYNSKTLRILLEKNGWKLETIAFLYKLREYRGESWKKKIVNALYWLVCRFTPVFAETLVVVARLR